MAIETETGVAIVAPDRLFGFAPEYIMRSVRRSSGTHRPVNRVWFAGIDETGEELWFHDAVEALLFRREFYDGAETTHCRTVFATSGHDVSDHERLGIEQRFVAKHGCSSQARVAV